MGCDIHCYIEYRNISDRWRSFGGRINPGRWYEMFEALAGVRGEESKAVVAPRGYPEDAGWAASGDNHLFISDSSPDAEGHCSRANAEKWVASGSSRWYGKPKQIQDGEVMVFDGDETANCVTHPDWHTHSWLTTEEYARAIRSVAKPSNAPEYYAILAAMRQFLAASTEARLVFWFDN